jgi:spermidine synthase
MPTASRRLNERVMAFACFVSGAAGLTFEVVWFHRCGLVFGNSVWATSIVLSSFMAGLALGNGLVGRYAHRIRRFLRVYALLECGVAVTGVALTYLLPPLTWFLVPITRHLGDSPWLVNAIRLVTAFAVIALPATAMGATLPVLVGAFCHARGGEFGRVLGRFYGWNTLGAVLGVVGAELVLVPLIGVPQSAWVAALANLSAAAVAAWMSYRTDEGQALSTGPLLRPDIPARAAWRLLACAFLAGGALMALEVVWFRFLSMFVINSTLAISVMLAVVLMAIGLGGLTGSMWLSRNRHAVAYLPVIAAGAACAVTTAYLTFQFATHGSLVAEWYRVLWFSCALTFVTALLSGVIFTLIGEGIRRKVGVHVRAVGWLTLANTLGAMCGPLIATFVLLPALGMERAFFALSALYGGIAVLAIPETVSEASRGATRTVAIAAVAAVLVLACFPFGLMSRTYFARAAQPYSADGSRIVATREGPTETIFLMEQSWLGRPIYDRLVTNGYSMSGTHLTGSRYMRSFVYWPMLLHQAPLRRVLVVCYGVGVTAGAATDLESLESIDVVEISRDVVAMSDLIYASGRHPLHDPRVRLHLEDGRQFLRASDERFDLITGEPPPPLTPNTVNLYTREYFQLIHDRLAEGGITTYWLPVPRRGEYAVAPIIRAFCDVFADCSLWNGTLFDWMLVGTRRASGPVSEPEFSKFWSDPVVGPHLREIGYEAPQQIGATFLGDAPYLNTLTSGTAALTDDYPRRLVQRSANPAFPRSRSAPDAVVGTFSDILDPDRARRAFETSQVVRRLWPEVLAKETLPFFEQQRMINRVMLEGANPLRHISELHTLLTQTSLRRLPLWALGSNDVLQRTADMGNDGTGIVEYTLGERLLVARSYAAAASYFAVAQRRGFRPIAAAPLEVYALCMAGKLDAARQRAPIATPTDPDERVFWNWMGSHFGVGPRT